MILFCDEIAVVRNCDALVSFICDDRVIQSRAHEQALRYEPALKQHWPDVLFRLCCREAVPVHSLKKTVTFAVFSAR